MARDDELGRLRALACELLAADAEHRRMPGIHQTTRLQRARRALADAVGFQVTETRPATWKGGIRPRRVGRSPWEPGNSGP